MKNLIIFPLLFLLTLSVNGQTYGDFMRSIVERSPAARSLHTRKTTDSIGARRGLNPLDPRVSLDYYVTGGSAFELQVTQDFDFPTVYHQRNKISRHTIDRTTAEYRSAMLDLLFRASELYNTAIYYHRLEGIYTLRMSNLHRLDSLAGEALKDGNITAVESGKLSLLYRSAVAEYKDVTAKRRQTEIELRELGGSDMDYANMSFANFSFTGTQAEFVQAAMAGNGSLEAARIDSLISRRELLLARSQWAPGLSVGYKINTDGGTRSAIIAGITIPLWQNRNNVKYAKALIKSGDAQLRATESKLRAGLENLYDSYLTAVETQQGWKDVNLTSYRDMMKKALKGGAITIMEYLLDVTENQNIERQILDADYNRAVIEGRMALYLY